MVARNSEKNFTYFMYATCLRVCVCAVQLFICVSFCTKHHNSRKKLIVFYEQEINEKKCQKNINIST